MSSLVGFVTKVSTIERVRAWPYAPKPLHDERQEKAHIEFYRKEDFVEMEGHRGVIDPHFNRQTAPPLAGHLDLFNAVGEGPKVGSHFEIEIPG